jgi:hypothetical protein
MYRELDSRYGKQEAIDVMRAALYKHGRGFGETLKNFAPGDFGGLYDAFAMSPDGGKMFSPSQERCDEQCLQIKFMACPLQKAWRNTSVSDDELSTLLYCASALDEGTMDAAGFDLDIQTWKSGQEGCCQLKITKRES